MKYRVQPMLLGVSAAMMASLGSQTVLADAIADALTSGKVYGDFRLRYEHVDQDNDLKDADGLTLRSRLGYQTGEVSGFSALVEFEDSRTVAGVDDYNDKTSGNNTEYSVIADPETTEVDQGYLQYTGHGLTSKLGRQVIKYDNVRFVGDVGWRQDRQTFDAISFDYTPLENLAFKYAYLDQRNRIFAEKKDLDSKDHLINASYQTQIGKIVGYGYLLEEDEPGELAYDTYGLSFTGAANLIDSLSLLYHAEYASQEKTQDGTPDYDADYLFFEAGLGVAGITARLGYEMQGSDDGDYGFATPLATLHKFNGWTDQFLTTPDEGLVDIYAAVNGELWGGKWTVAYHDFSAAKDSHISDDFGDEINISYARDFGEHYYVGIKYATYSADDPANAGATTYADTDKFWVWGGVKF